MNSVEDTYDFVIVGSGGGSMCAALAMKQKGFTSIVLEKQGKVGGSTAFSGGVLWIPNNDYLKTMGAGDSPERARLYMDTLIGDVGAASSPQRRDAFIRHGADMLRFLEGYGMRFLYAAWPDYYSDMPGGMKEGRSLVSPLFNANELGEWKDKLGRYSGFLPIPLGTHEAKDLSLMKRTWKGRALAVRLAGRMIKQKLLAQDVRGSGNAVQGRMLQIFLREGLLMRTNSPVRRLLVESGRVAGVVTEEEGRLVTIKARRGVLLNAGGFSHNLPMREQYQPKPASIKWTTSNPGDTGEVIQEAMKLGAAVDLMDESWWTPSSFFADGTLSGYHVPSDLGKPFCMAVDSKGERIGNEGGAYMEYGQRMYARGAVPVWAILESRHRKFYTWGAQPPGVTPQKWFDTGYMKKADTIAELARACGIDPVGLARTVERFNGFAKSGVDLDFGRGASFYNRYSADPTVKPNPALGPIENPPFYAVAVYPCDVGTAGGILTDEHARVMREDHSVIPGLYATGNCTASVMGRCYPGAGASIAASFVFGYIAALHSAQGEDIP